MNCCGNTLSHILIWYVAGPNFRYKGNRKGVHVCELDGGLGGDLSSEALKCGGLYLVVTEVVPVSGGADKKKKFFVLFSI